MAVGVDNPARGLALAALGQYNKLIKIKGWTVQSIENIIQPETGERVKQKVKYKYYDADGNEYSSDFLVNDGRAIHEIMIDHTKGFPDPDNPGQYLGYDALWLYLKIWYSDNTFAELKQPIAQFKFKKIVVTELPPIAEAEDMAIYFLQDPDNPDEYTMYMKTMDESLGTYVWTQIGSTKMDMNGYQKEIDSLINRMSINYDSETIPEFPTARNVVGDLNYLNAALGYDTPNDYAFDTLDPYKGILTTLDPAFVKRRNVIEALNEHEKELGFEYDYGTGKLINLGVDPDHTVNLAEIIKEIGDVSKLELDHIPGDTPEEKKQHIKDHSWTIVDAINAAEEHAKIQDPTTPVDRTKYLDEIVYYREDADEQGWHEPTNPDGTLESKHIYIPRVEAIERTNPGIGDYKTYDLEMAGMKYDPKQAYGPVVLTDVITMNLENLVELSDGIYEYGALLNHYYVNNYVPKPGDPDPFNMTIIGSSLGGAPVTVTQCYDGTNEILFRIGDETTPYVPDEGHNITLKYSALNLVPYGKIEIPHLKIHKESPIDDEWWEEDIVLTPAEWVIPAGGAYLTHEYKMARILSEEATQPIQILSKSRTDLTIVKETKGSREVAFQINTTVAPTEDVTCRVRYQIPSEILAQYWLEYCGKAYNLNLCGEKIDILKNGVLDDVTLEICTEAGVPVPELEVGDKYIDFAFILADGSLKHAYLPVKDLFDPYVGHEAIIIEYVTDPTDPDYKKNRVKLLINQTQNDRKKDGTSAHDPLNPELITNPTLVQGTDGLYIKDASEDNFGATIYATRNVAQYLADGTGDEVLDPTAANIRKTVKPLDILDFVKYSKSVDPSLKYIYEKDSTTHEHLNKTMIDAFNEVASVKIDTQHIKTATGATDEEKATYIEAYRLYTTPDPTTTTKNFLGDKIYDYRSIVPTSTLKADAAGPFYPSQVNDYTLYYLNQREAKGTTPETYNEVGFYLWDSLIGFYPVGGKDIRGKEAIGVEWISDDSINEVSLIINEYKNDENLVVNPDGSLTSKNPVLIQKMDEDGHEGLYAAHAYRAETDPADPSVVIPRQWGVTTFASEDQVLGAEEKNLAVSPLDLHTFVNDSESVNDDFRPGDLYEDGVTHERLNKTMIDAFNELASIKAVDTRMLSDDPLTTPTIKEKAMYSAKYELWTLPDAAQTELHHLLGDMIYDYKSIVQTETLAPSETGPFYPEQINDYTLYYHSTKETIEDVEYPVGVYLWKLIDPADPDSGAFFIVHADPIIDVTELPTGEDIEDDYFYRTHNHYVVNERYALTETALKDKWSYNATGLVQPDGTVIAWADLDVPAQITAGILEVKETGNIYKVTDNDQDPALTYITLDFNSTPVELKFHDPETDTWVDVISKYYATPDLETIPVENRTEWQIYMQLEDTEERKSGAYIWDGKGFVQMSADSEAILDVEELPEINIAEELFYRTHNDYSIDKRYEVTEEKKKLGYRVAPEGYYTPGSDTPIAWVDFNIEEHLAAGEIEQKDDGDIFVITDRGSEPPVTSVIYNFNSTPVELSFHDAVTNQWVDLISKYVATSDLKTIENPTEWEIYIQLNDTPDYEAGMYIWDQNDFVLVASDKNPIIDVNDYPETDIQENSFYRSHRHYNIVGRYTLTHDAKAAGTTTNYAGVKYEDGTVVTWADANISILLTEGTIEANDQGNIYVVTIEDDPTEKIVYDFNSSPVELTFHDPETNIWVDLISKYHAESDLDLIEVASRTEWQIYVQLSDSPSRKAGAYIWDGKNYVSISSRCDAIIDVVTLPDVDIEGNEFYRMHRHYSIDARYGLTVQAKAQKYKLIPAGIVNPDGTVTLWPDTNIDPLVAAGIIEEKDNGEIFVVTDIDAGTTSNIYNFNSSPVSLQFYDEDTETWVDVISKYIAVNDLTSIPITERQEWEMYVQLNNTEQYKAGIYIWDRNDFVAISSKTEVIIDIDELPEVDIEENSFYRTYAKAHVATNAEGKVLRYKIAEDYKTFIVASKDGVVNLQDSSVHTYEDILADWDTYAIWFARNDDGMIWDLIPDPNEAPDTHKLVYHYYEPLTSLQYRDPQNNRWIDLIRKFKVVNELVDTDETQVYFLTEDIEKYPAGAYYWDGNAYIKVEQGAIRQNPTRLLPTADLIDTTKFYTDSKPNNTQVTCYELTNEAIKNGWFCNFNGIVNPDLETVIPWNSEVDDYTDTFQTLIDNGIVERNTTGQINVVVENTGAAIYNYFKWHYFEPDTHLNYYDIGRKSWVDVLQNYVAVTNFTDVEPNDYQIYILLEDTEYQPPAGTEPKIYQKGLYIWNREDYVAVSSMAEAIKDVDELPGVVINDNIFYRIHNIYDISERYTLTAEAAADGWAMTPEGLTHNDDPVIPWTDFDPEIHPVEASDIGDIYHVKPEGEDPYYCYRFNSTPVELSFFDKDTDNWVDLISKYDAYNNLEDVENPQEWQLYVQLSDTETRKSGIYIWDGAQFVAVSSKSSNAFLDVDELPIDDIEDAIYRVHSKEDVAWDEEEDKVLRYNLTEAAAEMYTLTPGGLVFTETGEVITYEQVLNNWDNYGQFFVRDDLGVLFNVIEDVQAEPQVHKLVYRFWQNKTQAWMRDPINNNWINVLGKYEVVQSFEGLHGDTTQLYILQESYDNYDQGIYYWDGDKFTNVNSASQHIVAVDSLPENPENTFYLTHPKFTYTGTQYDLTPEAKEAGMKILPKQGLYIDESTIVTWDELPTYVDFETNFVEVEDGPVKKFTDAEGNVAYKYEAIVPEYTLQFSDAGTWRDISSGYVPVTAASDISHPTTTKLYAFLEPVEQYDAGLYAWDGNKFISISSGGIINVTELPTTPSTTSLYELHLVKEPVEFKTYILEPTFEGTQDIFGIHVVDPDTGEETITCWADIFTNWESEWYLHFIESDTDYYVVTYEKDGTTFYEYRHDLPVFPGDIIQFWVYNKDLEEWFCLDDSSNSINGVYNYDIGEQDSDTLNITWEGTQAEYEALTALNSKTIYFVWDGEAIPGPQMSYNGLIDRPTINEVLLQGDMTLQELGIQAFLFKGEVESQGDLPTEGNKNGDTYSVKDESALYAWDGIKWDKISDYLLDLDQYQKKHDEDLLTENKDVVPAINELLDLIGKPEKITFSLTDKRTGSSLGNCMGIYSAATKTANVRIELNNLGITDEGTYELGKLSMTAELSGPLTIKGYTSLAVVDGDIFSGIENNFATTNAGIGVDGGLKMRTIMGATSITDTGIYKIDENALENICLTATIFIE